MGGDDTRWSLIRGAAEGRPMEREEFVRRYASVIRAYLSARWRGTPLMGELDDAAQDVFVDCFRQDGALSRVDPSRPGGFRAFLYGVVRNVALRMEDRRARSGRDGAGRVDLDAIRADEEPFSRIFDRAWAEALVEQAAQLQTERARAKGETAVRRIELLRLRFQEGLSIREVARQWDVDPAWLHHQYAYAREEFKTALRDVVRAHSDQGEAAIEAECARLLLFFR